MLRAHDVFCDGCHHDGASGPSLQWSFDPRLEAALAPQPGGAAATVGAAAPRSGAALAALAAAPAQALAHAADVASFGCGAPRLRTRDARALVRARLCHERELARLFTLAHVARVEDGAPAAGALSPPHHDA